MTGELFPVSVAVRLSGASYRQVDHWCRSGFVPGQRAPGTGHRRMFTVEQLVHVAVLADLAAAGIRPGSVAARVTDGELTLEGVSVRWSAEKHRVRIERELGL